MAAGQAHDGQIADQLLDRLAPRIIVLADKAYAAARIRSGIKEQGATPNIAAKRNTKWRPCFSNRIYRERNLIERFFNKIKHFGRAATRYAKFAANFIAIVQLASMRLWMRVYESPTYTTCWQQTQVVIYDTQSRRLFGQFSVNCLEGGGH